METMDIFLEGFPLKSTATQRFLLLRYTSNCSPFGFESALATVMVGAEIFSTLGGFAPALGLIGTLIGLVQMLQSMDDPSSIGPAMAVALLTTFYGAILANLVFNPIAEKLKTLIEFYPKHIKKEDKVFFPASRSYFTDNEDQAMLAEFWEFDRKMIHEKYKAVVESLGG